MDIDTLEGLRKCPLFEGLTDNEIIDLMHAIRYRVTRLYKGDFLFVAGEVTVQAMTNTKVLRIHSADFERLLELDSRLTKNFTVILSNLIAGLTKKVRMLLLSVRDKIVFFLKEEQRRQQSNTILLSMSRQELADHFGIQKYSLQRALNELQESGAIHVDGKTIEILKL